VKSGTPTGLPGLLIVSILCTACVSGAENEYIRLSSGSSTSPAPAAEPAPRPAASGGDEEADGAFLGEFRALLKKRAYDKAAELAGKSPGKHAKEHAKDARLLGAYLDRALANAKGASSHRIKVHGMSGRLVGVEGRKLKVRARGAELTWPVERLQAKDIISLAEIAAPPEPFAMRALLYYGDGDIAGARREAFRAKGDLAVRVKALAAAPPAAKATGRPERRTPAGKAGLVMTSVATGASAELALVSEKGRLSGRLSAVKLEPGRSFVEVAPAAAALEVRLKARFAMVPGFLLSDAVFDPAIYKGTELYVPAESFLMLIPEGGKSAFVVAWPPGGRQLPLLIDEGSRFGAARVTFDGKPLYVGLLDHVAYVDDLASRNLTFDRKADRGKTYSQIRTGFKFPFGGGWTTAIAKPEEGVLSGMPSDMWGVRPPGNLFWTERHGMCMRLSTDSGGEWVMNLDKALGPYSTMVVYPKTRTKKGSRTVETPRNSITLTDILYESLGQSVVDKVIARSSMKQTGKWGTLIPQDKPGINVTCGTWNRVHRAVKSKDRAKFVELVQGWYNFCYYNMSRSEHYVKVGKEIAALSARSAQDAKLKGMCQAVTAYAEELGRSWDEENRKFHDNLVRDHQRYWQYLTKEDLDKASANPFYFAKTRDFIIKVFDDWAQRDASKACKMIIRRHWITAGGFLDHNVSHQRGLMMGLGSKVTLAGVRSPAERDMALKLRAVIRASLGNWHYKEDPSLAGAYPGGMRK